MVQKLQNYKLLKSDVVKHLLDSPDLSKIIKDVKKKHETCIGSNRRLEEIDSPSALIYILEKRNCLTVQDVKPLIDIINQLNSPVQLKNSLENYQNNAQTVKNELSERETENKSKVTLNKKIDEQKKMKIFRLLAEEMGRSWRNLGRNLSIKEAELDCLHEKFPTDLKSKVLEMLRLFETQTDPSNLFNILCDALKESRRNDLKNIVSMMLCENSIAD